jgi:hypothetical protein
MDKSIIYLKKTRILIPEITPQPDSIQSLTTKTANKNPRNINKNLEKKSVVLNNKSISKPPISQKLRYSNNIRRNGALLTGSNIKSNIIKY